ncbi:acyltransferase family protein [Alteromonas sp. BZK5]|uniref:acyltransferase family protein n=1 Tax=Alteromonas sp. BZK5 TaxID=1904459 RepID=UPI003974D71B
MIKHSQRKDIQGLRALAVLSVVIFHISPANLKGGYLGVDVFFVISGYLIIGQIWR